MIIGPGKGLCMYFEDGNLYKWNDGKYRNNPLIRTKEIQERGEKH